MPRTHRRRSASWLPPGPLALGASLLLLAAITVPAFPVQAQAPERIWGRVVTEDGATHTGFVRFRGVASWEDFFIAGKNIPEEHYQDWLDATRDGKPHLRIVELKGHRISWEEKHPDFVESPDAGIRVGHLASLIPDTVGDVEVLTRAGVRLELTEPRWRWRDIVVEADARSDLVHLHGRDVTRIEFAAAPEDVAPRSRPLHGAALHGTVRDRSGRSYTGFVDPRVLNRRGNAFLDSHMMIDFEDEDRPSIRVDQLRSLERTASGVVATLTSGEVLNLADDRRGPFRHSRPFRISDPELGSVSVEWRAFHSIRFHQPSRPAGYDAFDGGRLLHGTVVTRDGEELAGRIRWNAHEEWSWERLNGTSEDVDFAIEFANIRRIERTGEDGDGVRVTVLDGRTFELTGSSDVGPDNKGIFVFPARAGEAESADAAEGPPWRYVAWDDFGEARFLHGPTEPPGS